MRPSSEQKTAAMHREGPCLLLAGPGSGKTFTLIERIEYLIRSCAARPESILMLTFSRASANEMKERCVRRLGTAADGVFFGTFHSFFFSVLQKNAGYGAGDVVAERDRLYFLEQAHGEAAYREWKESEQKLDYTDMEQKCLALLTNEEAALIKLQQKYRYLMIDEFQDISETQYQIVRLLAKRERNLFAVGDDDQSIYGFRGAKPEIMLRLREDYPELRILRLGENYRCPDKVVRLSDRLIRHNAKRYPKKLRASARETHGEAADKVSMDKSRTSGQRQSDVRKLCARGSAAPADVVNVSVYGTWQEECEEIVRAARRLHENGVPLKDIAVIARMREDLRRVRGICARESLLAYFPEKGKDAYEHPVFRDLWAYLQAASGNRERKHFLRILNRPERYLSRGCLEDTVVDFDRMCSWYGLSEAPRRKIRELEADLGRLSEMGVYAQLHYICRRIGYAGYLEQRVRGKKDADSFAVLEELLERSKPYLAVDEWKPDEEEDGFDRQMDGIRLLTIHGAKGLEFPYVFVMGLNEGAMPSSQADTAELIEEERRMCYVALTRTGRRAFLSCAKERNGKPMKPSRFLAEMGKSVSGRNGEKRLTAGTIQAIMTEDAARYGHVKGGQKR